MANENLTPEEQLLKIIESGNPSPSSPKGSGGGKKKGFSFGLPSFSKLKGMYSFFKGDFRKKFAKSSPLKFKVSLRWVNRLLIGFSASLGIFLVVNLAFFRQDPEKTFALDSEIPASSIIQSSAFQPKPVSYYKEPTQRRNLFAPLEPKKIVPSDQGGGPSQAQQAPKERQIDVLTQGFKLVGISWGNDPQAMIEDTAKKRTYFVRPGQTIDKIQVRGVFRDRVVLGYEDQEKELF